MSFRNLALALRASRYVNRLDAQMPSEERTPSISSAIGEGGGVGCLMVECTFQDAAEDGRRCELEGLSKRKQQRLPPWQWKDVRWTMGSYITLVHVLGFAGLFYLPECKTSTLWWAFVLWPVTAYGITGGAHRL